MSETRDDAMQKMEETGPELMIPSLKKIVLNDF